MNTSVCKYCGKVYNNDTVDECSPCREVFMTRVNKIKNRDTKIKVYPNRVNKAWRISTTTRPVTHLGQFKYKKTAIEYLQKLKNKLSEN